MNFSDISIWLTPVAIREHFAHKAMVEELTASHLRKLDVSHAAYNPKIQSYKAEFTGVSGGGHDVKGTIVLDRQKAFWTYCNHPLAGGYKQ